jgi:hypothetical protein
MPVRACARERGSKECGQLTQVNENGVSSPEGGPLARAVAPGRAALYA